MSEAGRLRDGEKGKLEGLEGVGGEHAIREEGKRTAKRGLRLGMAKQSGVLGEARWELLEDPFIGRGERVCKGRVTRD